jgi:hypothetical protein
MRELMADMDSYDVREVRAYKIDILIGLLLDIRVETKNIGKNAGLWVHAQKFFDEAQECDEVLDALR